MYDQNKKGTGMLIFFFFLSDGFHLINNQWYSGAPITKSTDFALLYVIYVLVKNIDSKRFYNCRFVSYKWQRLLFVFITFDFILTVIFQLEQFGYAFKTYRMYIPLLSFYLIQELDEAELRNVIKRICVIVLFTVFLHVSQLVLGVRLLQHSYIDTGAINSVGFARYRNIPYLCYFLLIYLTVVFNSRNKRTVLYFLLCLVSLLISQHRGPIIAFVAVISYYMLIIEKGKEFMKYVFAFLFVFLLSGDYIVKRFASEDTGADVQTALSMDLSGKSVSEYDRTEMGNFTFRVLLLRERVEYLLSHPQYALTGVGLRHEDSPNTDRDFKFYLGTGKPTKEGLWIPAQIFSVDLAWQTPLMLFGFGGLGLFCVFTFMNMKYLYIHKRKSNIAMAAYLFYVFLLFISMKNDHLFGMIQICFLTMFVELIRKQSFNHSDQFKLLGKV